MDSPTFDIAVIGAGPSALSFAAALRDVPLRLVLIDPLPRVALADPPYDGREIALTRRSVALMQETGLWERIEAAAKAPLRGARVYNGPAREPLEIGLPEGASGELGYLVSNHLIRRAAFEQATGQPNVTLLAGTSVEAVDVAGDGAALRLADGRRLRARLVVAADSRFSATRRAMGIATRMHDFGKTMLVCRMEHEVPHGAIAWEWFGHHQTLALLPLAGDCSSVVLTLPHHEIVAAQALSPGDFGLEMQRRFEGRLGRMVLASERHAYPLVATYPQRFVAARYAVIGDAAVGMHPVTAHGYNFALLSCDALARRLRTAVARGEDIGAPGLLEGYEREHRRATRPLFLATNAVVALYTNDTAPARLLRGALHGFARRFPPVGGALSNMLTHERPGAVPALLRALRPPLPKLPPPPWR